MIEIKTVICVAQERPCDCQWCKIVQEEVNRAVVREVLGAKDTDEILPGGRIIPGVTDEH